MRDDPALLAWFELCPPCRAAFSRWQCAPNPAPRLNPRVARYPHLVALLDAGGAGGPTPAAWRRTISGQLLLIRRICTERHGIDSLGYAGWPSHLRSAGGPQTHQAKTGRVLVTTECGLTVDTALVDDEHATCPACRAGGANLPGPDAGNGRSSVTSRPRPGGRPGRAARNPATGRV